MGTINWYTRGRVIKRDTNSLMIDNELAPDISVQNPNSESDRMVPDNSQLDIYNKLNANLDISPTNNQTQAMKKRTPSEKQIKHLEYARRCKQEKQVRRDDDLSTTNSNLNHIYRRLTNIENQMCSVIDSKLVGVKRSKPEDDSEVESQEKVISSGKKQKLKSQKPMSSYISDMVYDYAFRGALVFGAGLVFRMAKQYLVNERRTTQDGDQIGNYYIGPDN
jgi:hypothetical protein